MQELFMCFMEYIRGSCDSPMASEIVLKFSYYQPSESWRASYPTSPVLTLTTSSTS